LSVFDSYQMDILQVTPRYPPSVGGIQQHVRELSEHLAELGHDVTVVTTGEPVPDEDSKLDPTVERLPAYTSYLLAPAVTAEVRSRDPDLVHAHGYHSLTAFFARLGIGDTPFVFTPHYLGRRGSLRRKLLLGSYQLIGQSIFSRADLVIAVSEWEHRLIQEHFAVSSTVIPNGTAVERFSGANSWKHDRPYVFCLGRLEEYKGIHHVVNALTFLDDDIDLLIAGTGPFEDEIRQIAAANGVSDRVHFLGYVEDEKIPRLYAGAMVHATLSEFECYGLTVAESLAAGTPCVVRDATALREWTDADGCVGVNNTAPRTVADAIEHASGITPGSSEILSWEEMATQISERYKSVID